MCQKKEIQYYAMIRIGGGFALPMQKSEGVLSEGFCPEGVCPPTQENMVCDGGPRTNAIMCVQHQLYIYQNLRCCCIPSNEKNTEGIDCDKKGQHFYHFIIWTLH